MAHVEKYTKTALGHMLKHYERAKDKDGNYLKFGNQEIDKNKTYLNYDLSSKNGNLKNRYDEIINQDNVFLWNRNDVNVFADWIVTIPEGIKKEEEKLFFNETYKFLDSRYNNCNNIIGANVHLDETTPHMHFSFVPTTWDKKKNRFKVSAKEVLTRQDLKTFHKDLSKHMEKVFGRDIGIINGKTIGIDKVEHLKKFTKKLNELELAVSKMEFKRDRLEDNIKSSIENKNALKSKIKALDEERKSLESSLNEFKGKSEYEMFKDFKNLNLEIEAITQTMNEILDISDYNQIMKISKELLKELKVIDRELDLEL